jgi:hypothetical protein
MGPRQQLTLPSPPPPPALPPCRNLPGVEVSSVDRLNLLQLAPGGHMGRFVIFTKSAFDRLDKIFGEQGHRTGGGDAGVGGGGS